MMGMKKPHGPRQTVKNGQIIGIKHIIMKKVALAAKEGLDHNPLPH
jgi:hypothetical protein